MKDRDDNSSEFSIAFQANARLKVITNKIDELTLMRCESITEMQLKEEMVKKLRNEYRKIKARLSDMTQDLDSFESEARIIPIKKPKRIDEWFNVIFDAVKSFEGEKGYTPNQLKLWLFLVSNPPSEYGIKYDSRKKLLAMSDGGSIDRDNFNKRYDRYYPTNKHQ